ncbi:MAG: ABC transporter permease [Bifidobacteriaceae bacterium]|nr:ABC transporter permease [Bifidobacteriaceae bacterium]
MTAEPAAPALAVGGAAAVWHNRWVRFALRRAGRLVVSLWVVVTAAFSMIHLIPGDPVRASMGITASPAAVEARREALGLNRPILDQYASFIKGIFTGQLGDSIYLRTTVWDTLTARAPATMSLAGLAFVVALLIAVPVGLTMAVITRRGRAPKAELGFVGTTVVLGAIPDFIYCSIFAAVLGARLGWLPVANTGTTSSFVIPVLALALPPAAVLTRIIRVEVLGVMNTDYVRTARAKRLPAWRIYLLHALPNAVTATLTLGGMLLAGLMIGTVLVENVYTWPGLGQTLVAAITGNDYPLAQGIILFFGVGVLVINTVVDVALALLDPRSTVSEG